MGKVWLLLTALAVLGATPSGAQTGIVKWRTSSAPEPRGAELLRASMLAAHNEVRAAARMAPLTWSDTLAADAARYASAMAWSGRFEHSPGPRGLPAQGENLWAGTRGAFRYDEMVGAWRDEQRLFRDAPTPHFAVTGRWEDVGHYTQMVWGRTRQVGCAMATGRDQDFLVCRYLPAGNVIGQMALGEDPPARNTRLAMRGR